MLIGTWLANTVEKELIFHTLYHLWYKLVRTYVSNTQKGLKSIHLSGEPGGS